MKKIDYSDIPPLTKKWFEHAKRIGPERAEAARKAIEKMTGESREPRLSWRTGRPPKGPDEKYKTVNMRLHPKALHWAHVQAKRRRIGYQTFINRILLSHAS